MKILSLMTAALLGLCGTPLMAAETDQAAIEAIVESLEVEPNQISASPVDGLYEVYFGSNVVYTTADGRYLIQGDVFDTQTEENLTESRRSVARLQSVEDVGESSMVVFSPEEVQHTITVFTDIDCGYCRKLHRQMDDYNELGIKVRYMFFPRSGPATESWYKADHVWCSADRNIALTTAKAGGKVVAEDCGATPVAMHYEMGRQFGIRGTPAIVTDTGELIGGYVPPKELIEYLEE